MMVGSCTRLCSVAFGLALGIVSGLFMMLFAWASMMWGFGSAVMDQWSSIYPGFTATWLGGLIGFLWGLVEGFIMGVIFAWIYNGAMRCCKSCCGTAYVEK